MLKINLSNNSNKFLSKIPLKHANQITKKIFSLMENPYPHDSKKLTNLDYRSADVGEYRIIYEIYSGELRVRLIGKRNDGEVYKEISRI